MLVRLFEGRLLRFPLDEVENWEVTAFINIAALGLKIEEEITYVRKTLQVHGCRNKKKFYSPLLIPL